MSAEIGGGLIILPLLIGGLGSIIAAAVAAVVIGAAVVTAGAALVGVARGANALARKIHQRRIQASIDRQSATPGPAQTPAVGRIRVITPGTRQNRSGLAQQVAAQRQKMLDMYTAMSDRIDSAAKEEEDTRRDLVSQARQMEGDIQHRAEQIQENLRSFSQRTEQQVESTLSQARAEAQDQLRQWKETVNTHLSQRRKQYEDRLASLASQLERDQIGLEYAAQMHDEARELHTQLAREEDASALVDAQLRALDQLEKDYQDLVSKRMGASAIGVSVSYTQQVMEAWVRLDAERHQRQLLLEQMEVSAASLKALVEKGGTIEFQHAKKLPKETDFWADGAVEPLMEEGHALLAQLEEMKKQPGKARAADVEKLLSQIAECTGRLDKAQQLGRNRFVNCYLRMNMMKKAQQGFAASGWKAEGWGFVQGDMRKELLMRFTREGATADLILAPAFDPVKKTYAVQVTVERKDSGVIDEHLRDAQIRQLETNLQAQGLPVTGMHCKKGTAGKNAVGPSMRNRFQTPRTDGTEANG